MASTVTRQQQSSPPVPGVAGTQPARTAQVSLRSSVEAPGAARRIVARVAEDAGVGEERRAPMLLAVSEAVTNATLHAYPQRAGDVHLFVAADDGEITVLIADDGVGMRQPASRPGLGFGLMLMAEAADGFVIGNRGGGGTEVELRFRIGSPARA